MNSDFPTAAVGSSQAPTATVEKSSSASNTKIQAAPAGVLQVRQQDIHTGRLLKGLSVKGTRREDERRVLATYKQAIR